MNLSEMGLGQVLLPTLAQIEREAVEGRLRLFDGNKVRAARSLGISVRNVYYMQKRWARQDAQVAEAIEQAQSNLYLAMVFALHAGAGRAGAPGREPGGA